MKFTVGGESFDLTKEQVIAAMKDAPIEAIQKHVVEIAGQAFPPKQVFGTVTGRARQSFTTMEAQRVLTRLGFVCRRVEDDDVSSIEDRVASIETTVATVEAAVAGLHPRVKVIEAER